MKKKKDAEKVSEMTDKQLLELGKNVRAMYEHGYMRTSQMLWYNFIRGIVYGFGLFLGGTIVVGLVVWVLGFFEEVPVLQPLVEAVLKAINIAESGS